MSLSVVGGLGAILSIFFELYIPAGHDPSEVVWLATFPTLFVGIGKSRNFPWSKISLLLT